MDFPVRVFCRNQKSAATTTKAVITVTACVPLIASPSARPVADLNSPAEIRKRPPSAKFWSSTPMIRRTIPFITNITPMETMTRMVGEAFSRDSQSGLEVE